VHAISFLALSLDFLPFARLPRLLDNVFDDETHVNHNVAQQQAVEQNTDVVLVVVGHQVGEAKGQTEGKHRSLLVEDLESVGSHVFDWLEVHQVNRSQRSDHDLTHDLEPQEARPEQSSSHEECSPHNEDDRVSQRDRRWSQPFVGRAVDVFENLVFQDVTIPGVEVHHENDVAKDLEEDETGEDVIRSLDPQRLPLFERHTQSHHGTHRKLETCFQSKSDQPIPH